MDFVHVNKISRNEGVIQNLPILQSDDTLSVVYSVDGITRNVLQIYENTINKVTSSDIQTFGTGLIDVVVRNHHL